MSQVSSQKFLLDAMVSAFRAPDALCIFVLGPSSELTIEYNGGYPLFWLKHGGREFEPTTTELLEVIEGALL